MAGEAGSEVKIKISTEGAEQAHGALSKITSVFDGLQGKLKDFSKNLKETGGETGLFSVGVDTLNQAVTIFRNPLAAVAGGLVEFKKALHESAEAALQNYERMRELTATFGESVEKVSDVVAAYEMAGVSSEKLQFAASLLGSRAEHAGDSFLKFGINVRNAAGELKPPLELFDEVRGKLNAIPNAAERAGAASDLFGARMARTLGPALTLTAKGYEENFNQAKKYGEYAEVVHAEAGRTKKSIEELALAQGHYNDIWASTLGLPLEEFFTKQKTGWTNLKSAFVRTELGYIAHLFGIDEAQFNEEQAKVQDGLMKVAAQVAALKKEMAASPGHLTEEQAKKIIDTENLEYESQTRRLRGNAAYDAQVLRQQEDSASRGLRVEKEATEEAIRLEKNRFEKVLDAKRRTGFGGVSGLTPAEEQRLRQQHEDKIYQMELEAKEKDLAIKRAEASERIRILEDGLRKEELFHKEYAARNAAQYEYEKKAIDVFAENQGVQAAATMKLEIETTERATRETVRAINQRIGVKQQELQAAKGIASEERRITQELQALESERTMAEIDNTRKMAAARAELLAKTKQMAQEEAGLGQSIEQKAIARLQAQGKTEVTAEDIYQERFKMGEEARETHAAFAGGGAVSIESLQASREYGGMLEKMRSLGTTGPQASAMFEAQQNAAYSGRQFNAIPTGLAGMAPELQAIASQMKDSADSAVERLGATLKDVFEYFVQKFNRKLEFESARQ